MTTAGSFAAKAVAPFERVKSPEKGTPGVRVTVELKAGPNMGERLEWIGWLGDASATRTAESLSIMGFDGSDPASIMAREFVAVVELESYQNKAGETRTRPRIAWINDPTLGGRMVPIVDGPEVAAFDDRLKAAFAAAKSKAHGRPSTPGNTNAAADEPRF